MLFVYFVLIEEDDDTSEASDAPDGDSQVSYNITIEVHFSNSKMTR